VSTLAIVLIVIVAVLALFFVGGLLVTRRRLARQDFSADVARADRALEGARAADRGWDRALLDEAARQALATERPSLDWSTLHLVLVDDRPGVEEDRAHIVASGAERSARVILTRDSDGNWVAEAVE
jgi:hypothetical protein